MCGIFETSDLMKEQKKKYIRSAKEISKNLENDSHNCKYARNDIIEKVIKNGRGVKKSSDGVNKLDKEKSRENFRQLLGFKENGIYESKECSIIKRIRKICKNQILTEQYRAKNYLIDLVFLEHKLETEIDENGHISRSKIEEQKREKNSKKRNWISHH